MARSSAFAPTTSPGLVSSLIMRVYSTDPTVKVGIKDQFVTINTAYTGSSTNAEGHLADMVLVPTGPIAYLLVVQPAFGGTPTVQVAHIARHYKLSHLDPPTSDPDMVDQLFLFVGELTKVGGHTQLPEVLKQPVDAASVMNPRDVTVPTDAALQAAFATQDGTAGSSGKALQPFKCPTGANKVTLEALPKVLSVPVQLIPMLIDGPEPRIALERVQAMVSEFDDEDQPLFDRTLAYLRAACVTVGGSSATKEMSRMVSAWYPPARKLALFSKWVMQTTKSTYPDEFGDIALSTSAIPATGLPPVAPTLADYSKMATEVVDHYAVKFAASTTTTTPAPAKEEGKWSDLTKDAIVRGHGLPDSTPWTSVEIAPIWHQYEVEMRNSSSKEAAIQRTFNAAQLVEPTLALGEQLYPQMTSATARHIRAGRLASFPVTYESCDVGFTPLAFIERSREELVDDEFETEEYERTTVRTMESERSRSSRSKPKRPPATYEETISLLRSYARALEYHFTTSSPAHIALEHIFRALAGNRETWHHTMQATTAARFWWQITKLFARFFGAISWEADGSAPTIDVQHIVTQLQAGHINPVADMPRQFIVAAAPPLGGGLPPPAGPAGAPPAATHENKDASGSRVSAAIKALISRVHGILGPRVRFGTILNACGLDDVPIYGACILDAEQCQEFLTVGVCNQPTCVRRHTVGFTPAPAKEESFLAKLTPVIDWIVAATPEQLLAARNRRQRRPVRRRGA